MISVLSIISGIGLWYATLKLIDKKASAVAMFLTGINVGAVLMSSYINFGITASVFVGLVIITFLVKHGR